MNGRFLIDTNIVIALFGNERTVLQHLTPEVEVFTPAIVPGDVCYGAYKSSRVQENISRINQFASRAVQCWSVILSPLSSTGKSKMAYAERDDPFLKTTSGLQPLRCNTI